MKEQENGTGSKKFLKTTPEKSVSFFRRILNLVLGKSDPKWEKRRLLRDIDKSLRRMRQKYYSPKN